LERTTPKKEEYLGLKEAETRNIQVNGPSLKKANPHGFSEEMPSKINANMMNRDMHL
jgi:hypothetical protein